jgi:hypothetical protein
MAKIKVKIVENTHVGTHSFYAVPQWAGTLSTEEILEEALDGKSIEPSVAKAAIEEFMKAVQRNVKKGFRCQLGKEFLTVYPNIQASVKDEKDKTTGETIVATADMVNIATGKSRLGCTVSKKFSSQFAADVSWTREKGVSAATDDDNEDDITQGNENTETPAGGDGNGGNGGGGFDTGS